MTGILDRIKRTTVADLENVSGSFDDVAPAVYRPRVPRDMQRIATGCDDLKPAPQIPNMNAGLVRTDGSGTIDTRPFKGMPTERQRNFMDSLVADLKALDAAVWSEAVAYMDKMDAHGAWNPARGENASRWIDRLKAKVAELKARPVTVAPAKENAWTEWRTIAAKLAAVGGQHGARFAVDTEDGAQNRVAFWWVAPGKEGRYFLRQIIGGQGAVRVRMSPPAMIAIANKIVAAGPEAAMVRYGTELGNCGHCNRELTNDVSRAAGIGPKCRKNMGGWH